MSNLEGVAMLNMKAVGGIAAWVVVQAVGFWFLLNL